MNPADSKIAVDPFTVDCQLFWDSVWGKHLIYITAQWWSKNSVLFQCTLDSPAPQAFGQNWTIKLFWETVQKLYITNSKDCIKLYSLLQWDIPQICFAVVVYTIILHMTTYCTGHTHDGNSLSCGMIGKQVESALTLKLIATKPLFAWN